MYICGSELLLGACNGATSLRGVECRLAPDGGLALRGTWAADTLSDLCDLVPVAHCGGCGGGGIGVVMGG